MFIKIEFTNFASCSKMHGVAEYLSNFSNELNKFNNACNSIQMLDANYHMALNHTDIAFRQRKCQYFVE